MKALLPVAGVGSRLRPHTHTRPKALVQVAGKPVLGHILDRLLPLGIDEVILIVGPWGEDIKAYVQKEYPFRVTAVTQEERLGLGHAVYMGKDAVNPDEPLLIVLGDTIFQADLREPLSRGRSALGVRRVSNPRQFGVVELDGDRVRRLVEKPQNPPSDLAIVGIYYIVETGLLYESLASIIADDIRVKGEYQLTDALQRMLDRGVEMYTFPVENWWDCGNPATLLATNRELLERSNTPVPQIPGSTIIPPVSIAPTAQVEGCVIGPYVSIAGDARVRHSVVRETIINDGARVEAVVLQHSIIGAQAEVRGTFAQLNISDASSFHWGPDGD